MRWWIVVCLTSILLQPVFGQKFWDGGALSDQWSDSANWYPDGVPQPSDQVVLNNQFISGDYVVSLPAGNIATQILSLSISPFRSTIIVMLPSANMAAPGLQLNAVDTSLIIREGGIFKNVSGAISGNSIQLSGKMVIYDGGRYIHQTARSNASISDKLVFPPGTSNGVFEFDVPGTAGYTISITGKTFGSLHFKAVAAGGNKSYSGSGSANLSIKGDLRVETGANVTSTMTADILISGNLLVDGKLSLNPSTGGTTLRRFMMGGENMQIEGKGIISCNSNFRNFEITKPCKARLKRSIQLMNAGNMFINYGRLEMDSFHISGPGKFMQMDSGHLVIGDPNGINFTNSTGNIRTETKSFSKNASYEYTGVVQQVTGDALPDTVLRFTLSNPNGITLTQKTYVSDTFHLTVGVLKTDRQNHIIFKPDKLVTPYNKWNRQNGGWENGFIYGPFTAIITGLHSYEMPAGGEWGFAPIILKNESQMTEYYEVMNQSQINNPFPLSNKLLALHPRGSWSIKTTSINYQIAIPLHSIDFSEIPEGTALTVSIYNDTLQNWTNATSTVSHHPDQISLDSLIAHDQTITLGYMSSDIILPMGIFDFEGKKQSGNLHFSWNISGFGISNRFIIQESSDGQLFRDFGTIELSNQNNIDKRIMWEGKSNLLTEFGFYRVKYDVGGNDRYSQIIKIKLLEQVVKIFPNPAKSFFSIKFQNPCNEYLLEIVNIYGSVLQKQKMSGMNELVKTDHLQPGTYWIRISTENFSKILNLTKY